MPPLFRRTADRLTDAAPGWLIEAVRPAPAPLRWWPMLRMAVAVTSPLLVAFVSGNLAAGLLPAMGAMNAGLANRGGPYLVRITGMGAAGAAGALGYLIGATVHGHGWWTVPVVVVVAVLSALISTGGATGSRAGLQLLVMTVIAIGVKMPGTPGANALAFLLGVLWVIVLGVADWPLHPRAPERAAVITVYEALDRLFAEHDTPALRRFDTTLKNGYDVVLGARPLAGELDSERTRLVALLNQASLIRNALLALRYEESGPREPPVEADSAPRAVAASLAGGPAPRMPSCSCERGDPPVTRALCLAVRGAVELASGGEVALDQLPYERVGYRSRLREVLEQMWQGPLARAYTVRLALCMGVAAMFSEFGWFERSYWMMLTVALVFKPDFGSVFARAVQRVLGTLVGTLIGTLVLVLVPYGPLLLVPIAVCAALLPYGLQRNWGLMSAFQAPLVLLLVDLITRGGPELGKIRLVDTLFGCVIVLVLRYLPWSSSWDVPVGPRFAAAVTATANYLRHAFDGEYTGRARLRRRAYDALADLRTVFQRALSEPPVISRRVTTWMPAMTALEQVTDAIAITVTRTGRGVPPPPKEAVRVLADSLEKIAQDVREGREPADPGPGGDESLEWITSAVRGLRDTVSGQH